MQPDLDVFFQFCTSHLKQVEAIETDEGEEFLFQNESIGGYDFEEEKHYLNEDNPNAKKLLKMWQAFIA